MTGRAGHNLEAYIEAFMRNEARLGQFRLNKASTSSLLLVIGGYVVKLVEPRLIESVLTSQKRSSIKDFVWHETMAMRRAGHVLNRHRQCMVPTCESTMNAGILLRRVGVGSHDASVLSGLGLCTRLFPGEPLGYYAPGMDRYVYNLTCLERCDPAKVRLMISELCQGVMSMNQDGVFHNDLAPQNLLVGRSSAGHCCIAVIDFGAAYIANDVTWEQPAVGFIDRWYACMLSRPGMELRRDRPALAELGLSKDMSDLARHAKAIKAFAVRRQE